MKQTLEELRFPWHKIISNPLKIKIKLFLRYFRLSLIQVCLLRLCDFPPFLNRHFTTDNDHTRIQTLFYGSYLNILLDFRLNILWLIGIFFTVIKETIWKKFNPAKIRSINCLLDCPQFLLITFIGIFNIYIHCHKILRYPVVVHVISISINMHFSIDNWLCIKILRIINWFFFNFFSRNSFFNIVIGLIRWFRTVLNITNLSFILLIRIIRRFYFLIRCYRICRWFFNYTLRDYVYLCFVVLYDNLFFYMISIRIFITYFYSFKP